MPSQSQTLTSPDVASGPRNISHIAIGVSDMEAALRFYRDVIGLTVSVDHIEDFPGPEFQTYRRGVYLRWSAGDHEPFLVLDQTLDPRASRGEAKRMFDIGLHHFGFWVDDLDAVVARARAAGFEAILEPRDSDTVNYGEPAGRVIRLCLLKDPDGNVVQLDQRVDPR
jgi:glyoxylase I family protein